MLPARHSPRATLALSAAFLFVLALAACGGGSNGSPYSTGPGSTGGTTTGGSSNSISQQYLSFSPKFDTIAVGSTVMWTNKDNVTHTVTSNALGGLDSGDMASGASFSQTCNQAGSYGYHCRYHGSAGTGMYGVIVVE